MKVEVLRYCVHLVLLSFCFKISLAENLTEKAKALLVSIDTVKNNFDRILAVIDGDGAQIPDSFPEISQFVKNHSNYIHMQVLFLIYVIKINFFIYFLTLNELLLLETLKTNKKRLWFR